MNALYVITDDFQAHSYRRDLVKIINLDEPEEETRISRRLNTTMEGVETVSSDPEDQEANLIAEQEREIQTLLLRQQDLEQTHFENLQNQQHLHETAISQIRTELQRSNNLIGSIINAANNHFSNNF